MLKKYRNLWVFGDSYSTPGYCVEPNDSFWMLAARDLQVEKIYNYSWLANSLDSVVHTLISDSEEYDWDRDIFLIRLPPLVRLTVVSRDDTKAYHRHVFDQTGTEIEQQQILCHHGLENRSFYNDPIETKFEDPTWTEIQACRTLYLINSWLDSKQANYVIINLGKPYQDDSPATGKFLLEKCFSHPNNILKEKAYYGINVGINKPIDYDLYGWNGHHGPAGNQYFYYNSLNPKLKELNLC